MSSSEVADAKPSFQRIVAPRGLRHEVVDRIRSDIHAGVLRPGARLPTEQEMIAAFGVSRTVVREAVAALRAEGLVETRQGVGAFVNPAPAAQFRLEPGGLPSIDDVVSVMELRIGVETEAAELAAARASRRQIQAIEAALKRIDTRMRAGDLAITEDFAFHRSIAEATGNHHFVAFLEFLGLFFIPRHSVRVAGPDTATYLARLQTEHRAIFDAIRRHADDEARAAMRLHLANSRARYAAMAAAAGK